MLEGAVREIAWNMMRAHFRNCLALGVVALFGACGDSSSSPSSGNTGMPTHGLLRCGDLISSAQLSALGFDASQYDPDGTQGSETTGAPCGFVSGTMIMLFPGSVFDDMIDGYDEAIKNGQIQKEEGPSIGKESHWASLDSQFEIEFLSSSGRWAMNLSGPDKAEVEKLARALNNKP